MSDYDALERRVQEIRSLIDQRNRIDARLYELLGVAPEGVAPVAQRPPAKRLPRGFRLPRKIVQILFEKGPMTIAELRSELNLRYNLDISNADVYTSVYYLRKLRREVTEIKQGGSKSTYALTEKGAL